MIKRIIKVLIVFLSIVFIPYIIGFNCLKENPEQMTVVGYWFIGFFMILPITIIIAILYFGLFEPIFKSIYKYIITGKF